MKLENKMKLEKLLSEFNKELDEWLKTEEHLYNCIGYSEGQLCCLGKETDSNGKKKTGRQKIDELIRKHFNKI